MNRQYRLYNYDDIGSEDSLELAKKEINARTAKFEATEIRFTLLAVWEDETAKAAQENQKLTARLAHLYKKYKDLGGSIDTAQHPEAEELIRNADKYIADEKDELNSLEEMNKRTISVNAQIESNNSTIKAEKEKTAKYEAENKRKKHNYIPFIVKMLRLTANMGQLKPLVEESTAKHEERLKQKQETKKNELINFNLSPY